MQFPLASTTGSLRWKDRVTGQTGGGRGGSGGGLSGGLVRFYKSQCKSRDKYYLLFEERHSRYLLYRGRGPVCLEHKLGLIQRKLVEWRDWMTALLYPWHVERRRSTRVSRHNKTHNGWESWGIWGHFLLELPGQSFPSTLEWLRDELHQTTLWPNMWKCYTDFLFLGSSEWRQFVQLMSQK